MKQKAGIIKISSKSNSYQLQYSSPDNTNNNLLTTVCANKNESVLKLHKERNYKTGVLYINNTYII